MQKMFVNEIKKLVHQLKDHIWFPQDNIEGYLFRYGVTFLFGLLVVLFIVAFPEKDAKTASYVLFLSAIFLSSFIGNAKSGLLLTGFATSTLTLSYYPSGMLSFFNSVEIIAFITIGAIISVVVHRAKRADLGADFSRREKKYQQQIIILTEAKEQAEEEIRIREEFISIASHELKTPLTTTLLKLQTALHNVRHVSLAKFSVQNLLDMLESAEIQTKRLAKMINDLLNVSIIRTGRLELEIEECDIAEIAKEVVQRFAEKAEKEGVTINFDAKQSVVGRCDKVRLEQVITNLLSNALKYGSAKPIDVMVTKQGGLGKIVIRDHGIGIPREQRQKIFNLFERVSGNSNHKGLGIGLYISNQIIKAHAGKITVQSYTNRGTEFIVEIPL